MVKHCVVWGCNFKYPNRTRTPKVPVQNVSLHGFPTGARRRELREAWIKAIRREKWQPTEHSAICSQHFRPEDMDYTGQTRRLRDGAIPSVFLPSPKHLQGDIKTPHKKTGRKLISRTSKDDSCELLVSDDMNYKLQTQMFAAGTISSEVPEFLQHLQDGIDILQKVPGSDPTIKGDSSKITVFENLNKAVQIERLQVGEIPSEFPQFFKHLQEGAPERKPISTKNKDYPYEGTGQTGRLQDGEISSMLPPFTGHLQNNIEIPCKQPCKPSTRKDDSCELPVSKEQMVRPSVFPSFAEDLREDINISHKSSQTPNVINNDPCEELIFESSKEEPTSSANTYVACKLPVFECIERQKEVVPLPSNCKKNFWIDSELTLRETVLVDKLKESNDKLLRARKDIKVLQQKIRRQNKIIEANKIANKNVIVCLVTENNKQ